MSKELTPFEMRLFEVIESHWADGGITMGQAIAEIKAAILEHAVPKYREFGDDYKTDGYNQAVTEITEKLK